MTSRRDSHSSRQIRQQARGSLPLKSYTGQQTTGSSPTLPKKTNLAWQRKPKRPDATKKRQANGEMATRWCRCACKAKMISVGPISTMSGPRPETKTPNRLNRSTSTKETRPSSPESSHPGGETAATICTETKTRRKNQWMSPLPKTKWRRLTASSLSAGQMETFSRTIR